MKKIYFNDLCVTISAKRTLGILHVVKNKKDTKEICDSIKNGAVLSDITLRGYPKRQIFDDILSSFKLIDAAGGIVRKDDEYLLIKRFGLWDLPKGKTEGKEKIKETAVREVEEETGVKKVRIYKKLKTTYHIFQTRSGWKLKRTYWYLMETESEKKLKPQKNEDITKAVWMKKKDAYKAISGTYRSISDSFLHIFE